MNSNAKRYIELIYCDMNNRQECVLQEIPCENCPYNEHIEDADYPCYKEALDDLKGVWADE